jgi:hypothetical protein
VSFSFQLSRSILQPPEIGSGSSADPQEPESPPSLASFAVLFRELGKQRFSTGTKGIATSRSELL